MVTELKSEAESLYNLKELNGFKWCENQGINPNIFGRIWFYYTHIINDRRVVDKIHIGKFLS
jgi:hypothetical protein